MSLKVSAGASTARPFTLMRRRFLRALVSSSSGTSDAGVLSLTGFAAADGPEFQMESIPLLEEAILLCPLLLELLLFFRNFVPAERAEKMSCIACQRQGRGNGTRGRGISAMRNSTFTTAILLFFCIYLCAVI
jgi:hypothetical protein